VREREGERERFGTRKRGRGRGRDCERGETEIITSVSVTRADMMR
jgi:hypothetical protein